MEDAYLAGRRAAMEKLAYDYHYTEAVAPIGGVLAAGALSNYIGREMARRSDPRASMSASGVLAPLGYGASGLLLGSALGAVTAPMFDDKLPDAMRPITNGMIGGGLGALGGLGYGLYRSYKKPSEVKND